MQNGTELLKFGSNQSKLLPNFTRHTFCPYNGKVCPKQYPIGYIIHAIISKANLGRGSDRNMKIDNGKDEISRLMINDSLLPDVFLVRYAQELSKNAPASPKTVNPRSFPSILIILTKFNQINKKSIHFFHL